MKKEKLKNNKLIVIPILTIIILSLTGITLAKYISTVNGKGIAKIAKPIFEIDTEESLKITNLSSKGSYNFAIRNYDKNEINEVEQEYYIEIISNVDKAIEFELYNEDEKLELKNNKTKTIKMDKQNKVEHKYRLDIKYNDDKTKTEDIIGNIEIKIHSIQKNRKV